MIWEKNVKALVKENSGWNLHQCIKTGAVKNLHRTRSGQFFSKDWLNVLSIQILKRPTETAKWRGVFHYSAKDSFFVTKSMFFWKNLNALEKQQIKELRKENGISLSHKKLVLILFFAQNMVELCFFFLLRPSKKIQILESWP